MLVIAPAADVFLVQIFCFCAVEKFNKGVNQNKQRETIIRYLHWELDC